MAGDRQWQGDTPVFLMIAPDGGQVVFIDLDTPGWIAANADLMRAKGSWYLMQKRGEDVPLVVFGIQVREGEQPYYTARHVGIASGVGLDRKAEITCYGIGKKRVDGHVDRLWVLPNGLICTGDDVEGFALALIKAGGF